MLRGATLALKNKYEAQIALGFATPGYSWFKHVPTGHKKSGTEAPL